MQADMDQYSDIFAYLNAMHPRFIGFAKQQLINGAEEAFVFLDKDFNIMYIEDLDIRIVKPGDTIYLVPTIVGGGGKNNALLMVLAGVALFAFAPALGAAASGAIGGTITATAMQHTIANIGINLMLAGFTAFFTKKPDKADKATRNNMFGSLTNSTSSDTPLALHYGQVRAAGQFISGYILATEHSKSDVISVGDSFE